MRTAGEGPLATFGIQEEVGCPVFCCWKKGCVDTCTHEALVLKMFPFQDKVCGRELYSTLLILNGWLAVLPRSPRISFQLISQESSKRDKGDADMLSTTTRLFPL